LHRAFFCWWLDLYLQQRANQRLWLDIHAKPFLLVKARAASEGEVHEESAVRLRSQPKSKKELSTRATAMASAAVNSQADLAAVIDGERPIDDWISGNCSEGQATSPPASLHQLLVFKIQPKFPMR
jgi:hypothetical protein